MLCESLLLLDNSSLGLLSDFVHGCQPLPRIHLRILVVQEVVNPVAPFLPGAIDAGEPGNSSLAAHFADFVFLILHALHLFVVEFEMNRVTRGNRVLVFVFQVFNCSRFLRMKKRLAAKACFQR